MATRPMQLADAKLGARRDIRQQYRSLPRQVERKRKTLLRLGGRNLTRKFSIAGDADIIGSSTSIQDIVRALAKRGCEDLTSSMDACSDFPCAGGGFCDVYQGALRVGTKVAIKVLRFYDRPGVDGDSDRRKMLKHVARELYHWSKLRHPNVLPLMGLTVFRGHLSMVSQWLENGSLMSYIRLNPHVDRTSLCIDVCEGLCYIHNKGMVHGDLKAANIMVSSDGTAQIADFGNAQLRDLTMKFTDTASRGAFSVRWAAPELLLEEGAPQVSREADVYAYGMTALEVLTGEVPYNGVNDNRVIFLVAYEQKVPPRPEIGMHDDLWNILNSCWKRNQSERPGIMSIGHCLKTLFFSTSNRTCTSHASPIVSYYPSASQYETSDPFLRIIPPDSIAKLAVCPTGPPTPDFGLSGSGASGGFKPNSNSSSPPTNPWNRPALAALTNTWLGTSYARHSWASRPALGQLVPSSLDVIPDPTVSPLYQREFFSQEKAAERRMASLYGYQSSGNFGIPPVTSPPAVPDTQLQQVSGSRLISATPVPPPSQPRFGIPRAGSCRQLTSGPELSQLFEHVPILDIPTSNYSQVSPPTNY